MNNEKNSEQLNFLKEFQYAETTVLAGISRTLEVVALKPICENLGISWSWQFEQLKNDTSLGQLFGKEKILSKDGKSYEMIVLPYENFQYWLWDLKPTEKMNLPLWEEYKKGLVMYLLRMLQISIDEVKRLRRIEFLYKQLSSKTRMALSIDEEAAEARRKGRERRKEKSTIVKSIWEDLNTDPNQLSIEY